MLSERAELSVSLEQYYEEIEHFKLPLQLSDITDHGSR